MALESERAPSGFRVLMIPDLGATNPYLRLLVSALRERGISVDLVRRQGRRPLTRAVAAHGRPDLVHLQWHHRFFVPRSGTRGAAFVAGLAFLWDCLALRRQGVPFVWTVHNVVNHERRFEGWEAAACRMLARLVDRLHVHCDAAVPIVAEAYRVPRERIEVVPHGHYIDAYPVPAGRSEARRALGLPEDARVFLFFGQIRAYKGLEALLDRFARLDGSDLRLVVVGDPRTSALRRAIERRAAADDRVLARLEFMPDEELISHVSASDAVVLPYRDVLTSGSTTLAASFARPAILPRVGCLAELPADAAILYDPDREDALGRALERAIQAPLDRMGVEARRCVARFPWSLVAGRLEDVYRGLVPGTRTATPPAAAATYAGKR